MRTKVANTGGFLMCLWKVKNAKAPCRFPKKDEPNAVDVAICRMLAGGMTVSEIADRMVKAHSSIEKRIHWLQAKRWATYDGRLLTPAERVVLIERERQQFREAVA